MDKDVISNYFWKYASEDLKAAVKEQKEAEKMAIFADVDWAHENDYRIAQRILASYSTIRKYRAILAPETLSPANKTRLEKAQAKPKREKKISKFHLQYAEQQKKAAQAEQRKKEIEAACLTLDWSKPDTENAAILGVSVSRYAQLKMRFMPNRVKDYYGKLRFLNSLKERYSGVDWATMTNKQVADLTGVSIRNVVLHRKRLAPETVRPYRRHNTTTATKKMKKASKK